MSLLRASLTLLVGNALAQLLPLLLGPWITRLYSPEQFAGYSLVWTAASNLAVVACARYEMALPLARGAASLRALLALCLRVWAAVTLLAALLGAVLALRWPDLGWLPLLVGLMGAVQALALLATRQRAFGWLAGSRFLQWGLAALLQVGLGYLSWSEGGPGGLLAGAALALALALLALLLPLRAHLRGLLAVPAGRWRAMARRHRDFPLLNTPHAFAGAAQDTLTLLLVALLAGDAAMGLWALALRYLKAPATLVGAAVSAALYPQLTQAASFADARRELRRTVRTLLLLALPFALALLAAGPALFAWAFGEPWREAGVLARSLAPYLALHFVASPLAVVTLAWNAQAWALRFALVGQLLFVAALAHRSAARRAGGRGLVGVGRHAALLRHLPGRAVALESMRAFINRWRRRLAHALLHRRVFGERGAPSTRIAPSTCIEHEERLQLADHVYIGPFNVIEASGGVRLGEGVQITSFCSLTTHSSQAAQRLLGSAYAGWPGEKPAMKRAPIVIGPYCFIGPHSLIEAGAVLGKGVLVCAYSQVRGTVPDFAIVAGQPAVVVGDVREQDARWLAQHPECRAHYEAWTR
jgi:O-antigen/teichoic acid export membrane protein/acetyltransferase-like isoleucine patch superfamily enzyme